MEKKKRNILIVAVAGVAIIALVIVLIVGGKKNPTTPDTQPNEPSKGGEEIVIKPDGVDNTVVPDNTPIQGTGEYWNTKELSYTYDTYGHTITVGMRSDKPADYLYINPRCSDSVSVGYYMSSERSQLEIENHRYIAPGSTEEIGHPVTYEGYKGIKDFMILNRTYDTLNPAIYRSDEEYGARWANDPLNTTDGNIHHSDHIYIRAVEIASGNILAVMKLTISWVDDHFEMVSLESNDVYDTKEMSEADRAAAVDRAIEFLRTKSTMDKDGINKDYWDTARQLTLVEHQGPYFANLYDDNNLAVRKPEFRKYDTYAVNITLRGYGFVTVYVTPSVCKQGYSKKAIDPDNLDLQVFGYDAFYPATRKTLFVKDSFWIQ